ncbi:PLC-like phosphodiesterase [Mycena sanguinolenta]|uniref:PLC-like phosphodiesterase n=1 Tax=Mycena sanguinolenta TaxID=230812 RepID=A0A8H7DLC1_9AGAR|nr:PLC-like phosphodiesterase [Mycena sanguinolenta]
MALSLSLEPSTARGCPVPSKVPHIVSNSLPDWEDNIALTLGKADEFFTETSYPRFSIHPFIDQLTAIILDALDPGRNKNCLLFPTAMLAEDCRLFIEAHCPTSSYEVHCATEICNPPPGHQIFAVLFSAERQNVLKFFCFNGSGLSPRLAELCVLRRADITKKHSPLSSAADAKNALRFCFAGMLEDGENIRGVPGASPDDVYLYASGMQAIWQSHKLLAATVGSKDGLQPRKVAQVNLLYIDSYKFLELSTCAGYHFFSNDTIDEMETLLATGTPERPSILALYTDFPGNPHLRSCDLAKLRALSEKYNSPLVVDETVAGHLNCQILPYCDIVVSSLTKLFSGICNVLGGAMMLNPASRFYSQFKAHMNATYEDSLFDSDALVLEMNSREYLDRTAITNLNAEKLADMLYARSVLGGAKGSIVQAVHYPKYRMRENFERCWNPLAMKAGLNSAGYGYMVSVTFTSLEATKTFYSALQCAKSATLGSIFTLVTAFSPLAWPPDLMQQIKDRGVEDSLIRISVGIEDISSILKCVSDALLVAEERVRTIEASESN